MNDWAAYAVLGRMLERLLVVVFAGLSVYLGYRLFLQIPDYKDAQGEIKLPAMNMSVTFSRVGPGVFFAVFGVAVLLASYLHPITVEPPKGSPAATGEGAKSAGFQGANPTQEEQERSLNRVVVAHMIASLNGLQAVISQDPRLGNEDGTTIRDTKLVLMDLVWNPLWGDRAAFKGAVIAGKSPDDRSLAAPTRTAFDYYAQTEAKK